MKDHFVETKSFRKFIEGIDHINQKLKGVERMLLVVGEPGLGKTEAAIHYCVMKGAIFIRTLELMTGPWLLRTIVSELGGAPYYRADKNFELIKQLLASKPRTIIASRAYKASMACLLYSRTQGHPTQCGAPAPHRSAVLTTTVVAAD